MAHSFNISIIIKATVKLQFNISLPLILYIDSKLIYKCLIKLGTIQEKRLIINIICLHQLYKRREIAKIKQINRDSNPTDIITKSKPSSAFKQLINTNRIKLKTVEWVKYTTNNSIDLKAQGRTRKKGKKEKHIYKFLNCIAIGYQFFAFSKILPV